MAPSRGPQPLLRFLSPSSPTCPRCLRPFTTTSTHSSGHNRWSKIKHDKARTDSQKNRARSLFSQELATLSRLHGPDPIHNPRLADAIAKAKREGFPKSSITAAIERGQGRSVTGAKLEAVVFEAVLPGNVGVIVECETDSRLRTMSTLKLWVKEAGGTAGPCSYLFARKGRVCFESVEGVGVEEAMEAALAAGAEDIEEDEDGEGGLVVWSMPEETKRVEGTLAAELGLRVRQSEIVWVANGETRVDMEGEGQVEELIGWVDGLMEREGSVQSVAMNVARGNVGEEPWKELVSRLSA